MINMIELQVISRIIYPLNPLEIEELCSYDASYYASFQEQIKFILDHKEQYGNVPDPATFQAKFPNINFVECNESLAYIKREMRNNRKTIELIELFNGMKSDAVEDADAAWDFIRRKCETVDEFSAEKPMDLVKDAKLRAQQVVEYSKQLRIPTGFAEIDKAMYGGLSTVEELALLIARTNTGKSWVGIRMMETAQKNGFNALYYSPEMQASYLGTRFDTWRANFQNSMLHQGLYTDQYNTYLDDLEKQEASAYVVEDSNAPDNEVTVSWLKSLVKKLNIKELIIDGLSYMTDEHGKRGDSDYIKYKNLCADLFRLSKQCGCAVVVMMQANRASKDTKDEKGEVFPNIYNIEGSDHPARIATQVFAMRQIFDKHILDIRLEKARSASNQKPTFSYLWDINRGSVQYVPNAEDSAVGDVTPVIAGNILDQSAAPTFQQTAEAPSETWDEDIDF
jgi:KaiC/GvpD/RAD55 family RecA-like ATPase